MAQAAHIATVVHRGYDVREDAVGAWIVEVGTESADEALAELRRALPDCTVDFTGDSNTDGEGNTTDFISIRQC